ncbi:MAG: hypothetical protein EBX02_10960, partial [Betaproteobacteria bacterium]|nr:hypothetical protein [Betaproteobacteria bacterium]
ERWLLGIGGLILLPAVLLLAWLEPMLQSRSEALERLARLERERATMQALAQQWRSLDQQNPVSRLQNLESRIRASLQASEGLEAFALKLSDNGSVLLEAQSLPQAVLLPWLVDVRRQTQSQWAEFRLERSAKADHLKVRIRFVEAAGKSS